MQSAAGNSHALSVDKVYTKPVSSTRLRKFFLDETPADVLSSFENAKTRIPAHKILLAMESGVFKAMFNGSLKETGDIKPDIKIVDVSADAFKEFLQFFYFDQIKLTMKNINEVIYLIDKYILADSLDICEKFLTESLTNDNVCSIYDIAIRFNMIALQLVCKNRIAIDTNLVLQSGDFKKCSKSVLNDILKIEPLTCTASQVFHACMHWIKVASGQDVLTKELLRMLYFMRFILVR